MGRHSEYDEQPRKGCKPGDLSCLPKHRVPHAERSWTERPVCGRRYRSRWAVHGRWGAGQGEGGGTLEPSIIQDGTQWDMRIAEWPSRHKEAGPGRTGPRASPVLGIESSQVALLGALPAFQWVPGGCHPNAHAWPHVDPPSQLPGFLSVPLSPLCRGWTPFLLMFPSFLSGHQLRSHRHSLNE